MKYSIIIPILILGLIIIISGIYIRAKLFIIIGCICIVFALTYLYVSNPIAPSVLSITFTSTNNQINQKGYLTVVCTPIWLTTYYQAVAFCPLLNYSATSISTTIIIPVNEYGYSRVYVQAITPFGTSYDSSDSSINQITIINPNPPIPTPIPFIINSSTLVGITDPTYIGNLFNVSLWIDRAYVYYNEFTLNIHSISITGINISLGTYPAVLYVSDSPTGSYNPAYGSFTFNTTNTEYTATASNLIWNVRKTPSANLYFNVFYTVSENFVGAITNFQISFDLSGKLSTI